MYRIVHARTHLQFPFVGLTFGIKLKIDFCSFLFRNHFFRHVDANKARYIETLKEAVAIKSVSAWPNSRPDVVKMMNWAAEKLKKLGVQVEMAELGTQTLPDGTTIPLPPAILGVLGNVRIDNTIIIYNDN